jgi:endonuclease/exonuclease/phosphatase (EEP) superfamily protein YafD
MSDHQIGSVQKFHLRRVLLLTVFLTAGVLPPVLLILQSWFWLADLAVMALPWFIAIAGLVGIVCLWKVRRIATACIILSISAWSCLLWGVQDSAPTIATKAGDAKLTLVSLNAGGNRLDEMAFAQWCDKIEADVIVLLEQPENIRELDQTLASSGLTAHHFIYSSVYSRHPCELVTFWEYGDHPRPASREWIFLVQHPERMIGVIPIHFPSPRTAAKWAEAKQSAPKRGAWAVQAGAEYGIPIIAAGDFNSTHNGLIYKLFRESSQLTSVSANNVTSGSWPSMMPSWGSLPIDHIFVDQHVAVISEDIGPNVGSDHRPKWSVIKIDP